ncbi:hypothetical protein BDV95DRAFT_266269 [Massariosphaeria phaeospora]|uniref:Uncharacterized protein n=1 Tax=Massariosphaeria phaeospora TaxID=100035 RepID=A0A7C8M1W1_9PLEO|nr:hypothetical protein BDV95DRAFT_266269 [Massariosphaeria phaeospora]
MLIIFLVSCTPYNRYSSLQHYSVLSSSSFIMASNENRTPRTPQKPVVNFKDISTIECEPAYVLGHNSITRLNNEMSGWAVPRTTGMDFSSFADNNHFTVAYASPSAQQEVYNDASVFTTPKGSGNPLPVPGITKIMKSVKSAETARMPGRGNVNIGNGFGAAGHTYGSMVNWAAMTHPSRLPPSPAASGAGPVDDLIQQDNMLTTPVRVRQKQTRVKKESPQSDLNISVTTDGEESEWEEDDASVGGKRSSKRGGKKEKKRARVSVSSTPSTNKNGEMRKPRDPRPKLLQWSDNDWKNVALGIVWACGENGLLIPFGQAAQLVGETCTAGALQQALLKLRQKQNADGHQMPPLKMAWSRRGTDPSSPDDTSTRAQGRKLPRRNPTKMAGTQSLIVKLKLPQTPTKSPVGHRAFTTDGPEDSPTAPALQTMDISDSPIPFTLNPHEQDLFRLDQNLGASGMMDFGDDGNTSYDYFINNPVTATYDLYRTGPQQVSISSNGGLSRGPPVGELVTASTGDAPVDEYGFPRHSTTAEEDEYAYQSTSRGQNPWGL